MTYVEPFNCIIYDFPFLYPEFSRNLTHHEQQMLIHVPFKFKRNPSESSMLHGFEQNKNKLSISNRP